MEKNSAQEIVLKALKRDELDLLLLGKPGYQYLPEWSSAPSNTDLPLLLAALCGLIKEYPADEIRNSLYRAIKKIIDTYEGLEPVACCLICEAVDRSEGKPSLGLPLEEIAADLRQSIRVFSFRLEKDKTEVNWPDGRLGVLRGLSKNTERLGGPAFCD